MTNNNRWRNYGLWVSVAAFIPLLLSSFGINILPNYQEIVNALLAILVTAGILSNPTTNAHWFKDDSTSQPPKDQDNSTNQK
ncbi:MAG: holin [Niameybacter sp.]|uniref:hypothetical protein n=1 Tax=Niameybacter sp. TaxID=2033640 RepID=UPI002FCA35BD